MQLGEHEGVTVVGFDPVVCPAWNAGRSHDNAVVPGLDNLSIDAVTASPSLITAHE
jgi:hypothetical protein